MNTKFNYHTKPSEEIQQLLVEKNSPCIVKVNNVLCSLSCEEIITWLRKTYGIIVTVDYYFDCTDEPHLVEDCFEWCISWPKKEWDRSCGYGYKEQYEDAMMEGIKEALKLI